MHVSFFCSATSDEDLQKSMSFEFVGHEVIACMDNKIQKVEKIMISDKHPKCASYKHFFSWK